MSTSEEDIVAVVEDGDEKDVQKEAEEEEDPVKEGIRKRKKNLKRKAQKKMVRKVMKHLATRAVDELGSKIVDEVKNEYDFDLNLESLEKLETDLLPQYIGNQSYIVQGLTYMVTHEDIYKMVSFRVKVAMFLSFLNVLFLILLAYPWQIVWFQENTPLGFYTSILVAFGLSCFEGFFTVALIIVPVVYGNLQSSLFIRVYLENASPEALNHVEKINEDCCAQSCCTYAGLLRMAFDFSTVWINVIPIFGQVVYIKLNERMYMWELFSDYLQMHGVKDVRSQFKIVNQQHLEQDFAATAIFLKTLPVVGPIFALANAIGAALYAAQNEPCKAEIAAHMATEV